MELRRPKPRSRASFSCPVSVRPTVNLNARPGWKDSRSSLRHPLPAFAPRRISTWVASATPPGSASETSDDAALTSFFTTPLRVKSLSRSSYGWSVAEIWTEAPVGSAKTVSGGGAALRGMASVTADRSMSLAAAVGTAATAAAAIQSVAAAVPTLTRESRARANPFRSKQSRIFVRKFIPTRPAV